MEVDGNILLIVGDLQGILDQQFRPRPIHFLILLYLLIILNYSLLDN